ncbi:extracellular solute-binding protein [Streptomyces sp. NPDC091376]|uniref:extracellular solute-binding protein n=1 Tax=Streptomyces sp. NPDC091376 TaxID=3365994 RepID=UPI0038057000
MSVSRRTVLQTMGISTALATTGFSLAGCSTSTATSDTGNAGKDLAPWPTYVPHPNAPKPDLAPTDKGVQPGFTSYPKELAKAVAEKPGDGSKVTVWTITWGAPPKPKAKHKLWQAIEAALGVDLDLQVIPALEAPQKYATLVAGGELPDIIAVSANLPDVAEMVAARCQDLTEFLSGDAVKRYPNLAAIPAYAWKASGRIGGRLYRIPVERPRVGHSLYVNKERFERAGIWMPEVGALGADQLTEGLRQIGRTHRNKYPVGAGGAGSFNFNSVVPAFGAANKWRLQDGQFLTNLEDDQMKAGVEYLATWQKSGVHRPDPLSHDAALGSDFMSGITAATGNSNASFSGWATGIKDGFTLETLRPFKPANGAEPGHWLTPGADYQTALKKAPKERIELLLRVLDFLAAPFGTEEYELINYGVEGTHFERGDDGSPVQNELALNGDNKDTLGVGFLACPQQVLFLPASVPGGAETVRRRHAFQSEIVQVGVADPSVGLLSSTWSAKLNELELFVGDSVKAIIMGRKSLSDWEPMVKQWKAKGGDKAAEEYAKEYEAAATAS